MDIDRERQTWFIAHHSKPITDEFIRVVMRVCNHPTWRDGQPAPESYYSNTIARLQRDGYLGTIGFSYPNPWVAPEEAWDRGIQVPTSIRQASTYVLSNGHQLRFPLFEREPGWLNIGVSERKMPHDNTVKMAWFLDRAQEILRMFDPDFACAGAMTDFADMEEDPRSFAWPVMLYGPDMVERVGRQRLLDAPAWKVEGWPYGGVWLQVAENPFTATQEQIAALASHLGLRAVPA